MWEPVRRQFLPAVPSEPREFMTMPRYQLILFDLDGTLVDSVPDLTTALSLMLAELGLPAHDEGTVRQIIGEGQRSLVERALLRAGAAESPQAGLADAVIDDAVLRFRRHYSDNLCVRTRLYDGVRETLHALSASFPLAVATNKPGHWARTLCEVLELSPLFRWVLGEDDVGARKPDPKLLLELCRRAAVPVERTLFVGDSRIDWRAAEAAGMDLALCTYGYGGEAMRSAAEQAPATQVSGERLRRGCARRPYVCYTFAELLPIVRS